MLSYGVSLVPTVSLQKNIPQFPIRISCGTLPRIVIIRPPDFNTVKYHSPNDA